VKLLSDLLDYLEPNDLLNGHYRFPVYEKYWDKVSGASFALPAAMLSTAADAGGVSSPAASRVIWLQPKADESPVPEVGVVSQVSPANPGVVQKTEAHPA
jgi:hypothetical protein